MHQNVYIISAKRIANGSFLGQWSQHSTTQLGSYVVHAVSQVLKPHILYMGCALQAGLGQAPARQALIKSGLNQNTSATTINKVCGSGMEAIRLAFQSIQIGYCETAIAGGMENMSCSPYILSKARTGCRMGHQVYFDSMQLDGLEDAYDIDDQGKRASMGLFADQTAQRCNITRDEQEKYVEQTFNNAQNAFKNNLFNDEIIGYSSLSKENKLPFLDEPINKVKLEKLPLLKPCFSHQGTITAAMSSSIADGASAICLTNEDILKKESIQPLAKIVNFASFGVEPCNFTLAPIGAIQKLCTKINWKLSDVDLFEINEAFAMVPIAAIKELNIPREKVNIHGGACVLGHPLGASGSRIVVTLAHGLKKHGLRKGIAAICIGGGESLAIALENNDF